MKKQIQKLREICDDLGGARFLLDELDRWADAQLTIEDLDGMSKGLNTEIIRLSSSIKIRSAMVDLVEAMSEHPVDVSHEQEAYETIKSEISELEALKTRCDRLRTLHAIDSMTEISK